MLINLWGTVKDQTVVFDSIPFLQLHGQMVGVKEVLIQWETKRNNFIGMITTSLIEKSPINLYQELLIVPQEYPGIFLYYTPTHISYYKTRLNQLNSLVVQIDTLEKELPPIKRIYLQLKLIDVGIQSSLEQ